MIVTTTNSIEGREISRYNDPIAASVVVGIIWHAMYNKKFPKNLTEQNDNK